MLIQLSGTKLNSLPIVGRISTYYSPNKKSSLPTSSGLIAACKMKLFVRSFKSWKLNVFALPPTFKHGTTRHWYQKQLELIQEFRKQLDKGYDVAQLRLKAAEGSKIDVLQAKVQRSEIELVSRQTQAKYEATWREIAAIAGVKSLPPRTLSGSFDQNGDIVQWEEVATNLIAMSPEYSAAQARISQAQAELSRHGVQAIPNVTVQLGAGVDNGTNSGMMNLQVGAPIPVFNKNQGNIAAARAEYCRAVMESQRIEQSIRARLAAVSSDYQSALEASKSYSTDILPTASEALNLAKLLIKLARWTLSRYLLLDALLRIEPTIGECSGAIGIFKGESGWLCLNRALDAVIDRSGSDALRGLTFSSNSQGF